MFQNDLDQQPRGWRRQDNRSTERQENKVHHNKDAESIQERTNDDIFPQEGNSVCAEDKNTRDDNGHDISRISPSRAVPSPPA